MLHGDRHVVDAEVDRNNWVVLVDTSRYWYNYRHVANVLSFYHTIKRLGVPDSQIILMLAEDMACNPRNSKPGTVINEYQSRFNLYGEHVEVDYRGDEVSVENFLRLLTGRHPPSTPRSKRLLTDPSSNVFIFITGHSGEEFIKFQDWEELTSNDIADAFEQMHKQRRYKRIFWLSDTCQAASLQNQFYTPGIVAMGSSDTKENSYSHHVDSELGCAVVDRFSYYAYKYLKRLTHLSDDTVEAFHSSFSFQALHSHPQVRSDLYGQKPSSILLTEFLASTGTMHFQNASLKLLEDIRALEAADTCAQQMAGGAVGNSSSSTCRRAAARSPMPARAQASAAKSASDILRSATPLLSSLPGLGGELSGERAVASLGSNEISTHPLGWNVGLQACNPVVVSWLIGFVVIACIVGVLL